MMKPIRKLLVGLDLTEMDQTLIKYVSFITQSTKTNEIIFLNNIRTLNIPDEVKKEFPDLINNAVKEREEQLKGAVMVSLDVPENVSIKYKVTSGNLLHNYLSLIESADIDLVIVGRKNGKIGSGIINHRLARRIDVSLMIVPIGSERILEDKKRIKKILVPVDFSKHSMIALERAIDIATNAKTKKTIKVICQHVYSVPTGYHYTGKSFKEFAGVMKKNAETQWNNFIKKVDPKGIEIKAIYTLDKSEKLVDCVFNYAKEIAVDGIIIGARGITPSSAYFIGSTAERMLKLDAEIPFLVVRKKGDKKGIIEYLKKF